MAELMKISANFDPAIKAMDGIQKEQLPFTIARTLTLLAQDGQAAGRDDERRVFKLRNDWTTRNTRIKPATKQALVAEVFTDTSNRRTGAPDYLEGQDTGKTRVPVNGRQHIAVPTKYLIAMVGGGVIPDELRPKAMLGYAQNGGKLMGRTGKLRGASAAVRGMYFFLVQLKKGGYAILGRAVHDTDAYPMYLLVKSATIPKRLDLEGDVQKAVDANLERRFQQAADEVMTNDALRGSGLSIKL